MCDVLQVEVMVVSLFATPEHGVLIQDSFAMAQAHNRIIGLDSPHFYFMKKVRVTRKVRVMWSGS